MKIRRLWLWIFLLLALALLALGVVYYLRNFTGLGPIPSRSAFAGRLPSIDPQQNLFRFFYASNRLNDVDSFEGYGNTRGEMITMGTFDIRISPYLPIKPFAWFDAQNIEFKRRDERSPDLFREQLVRAVQASPHKSLLIIVWGFRDWFRSAALKTAYSAYILDINTPVLLFDWPGNQGDGRKAYRAAQEMSARSSPDLGEVLAKIINETKSENIWLVGSSLGCETIAKALGWLAERPELLASDTKLSHVVFSAPDVSAQAFDEKFSTYIQRFSHHFTAYVSSNDRALLLSQWLNLGRRLGRKAEVLPPHERKTHYEFEEALELLTLNEKGAKIIDIVDATPINTTRNLHHFFTDSPIFFDDLYQRLLTPNNIVSRRLHSLQTRPNGAVYWILWND